MITKSIKGVLLIKVQDIHQFTPSSKGCPLSKKRCKNLELLLRLNDCRCSLHLFSKLSSPGLPSMLFTPI